MLGRCAHVMKNVVPPKGGSKMFARFYFRASFAALVAVPMLEIESCKHFAASFRWYNVFHDMCAPAQHSWRDAPALVICLLAGKLLDRPCTRWAPGKESRSIRRARSEPRALGQTRALLELMAFLRYSSSWDVWIAPTHVKT